MDGWTALGQALLSSLEMAKKGKVGSMVVICTDGLANLGIGNLSDDEGKEFYKKIAD